MAQVKKYRHLFFDLDHTLWDFDHNSNTTILELFKQYQIFESTGVSGEAFLNEYRKINDKLWLQYRKGLITKTELRNTRFFEAFKSIGFNRIRQISQFEWDYIYHTPRKTKLIEGATDLLIALAEHYTLHIITNGFAETQSVKLESSELNRYFDLVMTSDELQVNKPEARIFVESMKRAGAKRKESLMIGDNLQADVIGARNVGMDQIYYNPLRQPHVEKVTFQVAHLSEIHSILLD